MLRRRAAPLLVALLLVATASAAAARERVVVLDRGRGAKEEASRWEAIAARLAVEDGAALVLYGGREDGRPRIQPLTSRLGDWLAEDRPKPGWSFEGPTDPRKALEHVAREGTGRAVDVFLVGPFSGADATSEGWGRLWAGTWTDQHAPGSRILPVGASPQARAALEGLPGLVEAGWLVVGLDRVEALPAPYSPFETEEPRRCRLELYLDLAPIGTGLERPPFDVATDREADAVAVEVAPGRLTVRLARSGAGREPFRVRITVPEDPRVVLLVKPPPVLEVAPGLLAEHARLEDPDGRPAGSFRATGVMADAPARGVYALRRSATGRPPAWRARGAEAPLPPGLDVAFGPETEAGPEILTRRVEVVFTATPGRPLEATGTLLIEDDAGRFAFRLPYRVSVPPGRVRVVLEAPEAPQGLPWADDPPWRLRVEALDANAPAAVDLDWRVEPAALAGALRPEGLPGAGGPVPVGTTLPVRVTAESLPDFEAATVEPVLLDGAGYAGRAEGRGRLCPRRPRLSVAEEGARYRVRGEEVEAEPPLLLALDPDGGGEAWRRRLLERPPVVATASGEAPARWRVEPAPGGDGFLLLPEGPWRGPAPAVFAAREVIVPLALSWSPGEAPEAVALRVEIPPRWGALGWVLLALTALALALGAIVALHMRAPALGGTLLYAIEGTEGAVGRLDLAAVGRGRRALVSDARGRLRLEGEGTRLGTIESTRVGGFLRLGPEAGPAAGSHLLVDGLTVTTPGHRLRYVSGRPDDTHVSFPPEEVPDLLGPEFDLQGGRIGTLDPEAESPQDADDPHGTSRRS